MRKFGEYEFKAETFFGLMASEGLIPGGVSAPISAETILDRVKASVESYVSEVKENYSFFDLMEEGGQMIHEEPVSLNVAEILHFSPKQKTVATVYEEHPHAA